MNTVNYPRLIYHTEPNPDYGKQFTIDDVNLKVSYDFYKSYCFDIKTNLSYEDYNLMIIERELASKIQSSQCSLKIIKSEVRSFEHLKELILDLKERCCKVVNNFHGYSLDVLGLCENDIVKFK